MASRLPVAPMLSTAVAAAAVNILLAYTLARLLKPGRVAQYGPEAIAAVLLLAVLSVAAAVVGWRVYLRSRASPRRAGGHCERVGARGRERD